MIFKIKKILIKCFIIIFLSIFIFATYFIIKDYLDSKKNKNLYNDLIADAIQIDEETQEFNIDWNYLKSINEDIIAWIKIEDTNINYPILKDTSELYYLYHSYNKTYNKNGSIFTLNNNPFIDEETVIYGHNMKNSNMFSSLSNYMNEDFLYSHLKIKIYTPDVNYEGTIFSIYSIGIETEINNIKELNFNERIKYYTVSSKYNLDTIDNDNVTNIIKLSTCSYINARTTPTDQRYYIIASIISE